MNADTGDGHMLLQRRLPAGRHAPRHAFAPHLTANSRAKTARNGHPNRRGTRANHKVWEGGNGRRIESPEHPLDTRSLMLQRQEAIHGFLPTVTFFQPQSGPDLAQMAT